MAYTDDDLREMLIDCIGQIKALGYEMHSILDIKFSPGFGDVPAYFTSAGGHNPYICPAYKIRIHSIYKTLEPEDYMELKTIVMREAIHAIRIPELEEKMHFHMLHYCSAFRQIARLIERIYGYEYILYKESVEYVEANIQFITHYATRIQAGKQPWAGMTDR